MTPGFCLTGSLIFVMDLVEGSTLTHELTYARHSNTGSSAERFSFRSALRFRMRMQMVVIHRDIKPSNIMLVKNNAGSLGGTVKVVDFGIAKLTGKDEFNQLTLTKTGEIFGSPLYMSPEQCMGVGVDLPLRSVLYGMRNV